jgi:preprotein translocase subunit YajC
MNLIHINSLLQAPASGGMDPIVLMLIMGVFFFFMIWPQMRRQKKTKNFIAELKKGDQIVTTGGVHGKISTITEKFMIIDLEEGKMKIELNGVSMENTQAAYPAPKKEA